MKLKSRLSLFNIGSKLILSALFVLLLPYLIGKISITQIDNELIQKRERFINLIAETGIEPFISSDSANAFGSYNILKEEYISIERTDSAVDMNFIEVSPRLIEGEEILYRVLNYSLIVDGQNYLMEVGESLASIRNTEKNIRNVLLVFLVLFIIITWFLDFQHTNYVLKPLDAITRKLQHISDPSQFDHDPVKTNTDDFAGLDKALISLMDNINILFQREKEITVNISHELMTPISVLRSKLENLLLEESGNHLVQVKIEECLRTLQRLQALVNSLLMIARIEGQQYVKADIVDMQEVIGEITGEIRPLAEDKDILLEVSNGEPYWMNGANRSLIFSMINNIMINALKNTPPSGKISVWAGKSGSMFSLVISDTGKGLSDKQMEKLFLRFSARDSQSGDGTGIGLAIAKSIADFHQIKILVNSEPNKGTKISFIFPENS